MTTFYLDYEGGNDANAGTSFATRWKTITSGATAARIAPGDTIRIMASPDPTSIGDATWTGGGRPAAINISSSTNATPIVITTVAAHGLVPGDYVTVASHTSNTNANGVWEVGTTPTATSFQILKMDGSNTTGNGTGDASGFINKATNCIVKTATPLVQNIALCGGLGQKPAWTGTSTNITSTINTASYKEGYGCASIEIGSLFTTGKAAYYTLPATLDLSAYQQVSFWVRLNTGSLLPAGSAYIALCTDTLGATVAHQCPIPAQGVTAVWLPVKVDLGTNLNAAIRSVALYVATDGGTQGFLIDNIVACKASASADSVSLTSLISKSDGTGDEAWYAIQSINYDAIMLANVNGGVPTGPNIRGYSGTTETTTTYKRETIKTPPASASTATIQSVTDGGTTGSPITFSGGWDRTVMNAQTGHTWFDGQNGLGIGLAVTGRTYITLDRVNLCRYNVGYSITGLSTGLFIASTYVTASNTAASTSSSFNYFGNVWVNNNNTGLNIAATGVSVTNLKTCENETSIGVNLAGFAITINSLIGGNTGTTSANATVIMGLAEATIGFAANTGNPYSTVFRLTSAGASLTVNGGSSSGSLSTITIADSGVARFNNFTMGEATEVAALTLSRAYVYSNRHDDTDYNSWQWQGSGTINQQTSVVDSPATSSWKMNPTTNTATALTPLWLKLGTVVCGAGSLVTVTARMQRSNTGLTMRLICPGGQISGVSSDVISDMTAAANTWETVTITFTPTKPGGVDIYAHAFGGTTFSGYVCNLTASQV